MNPEPPILDIELRRTAHWPKIERNRNSIPEVSFDRSELTLWAKGNLEREGGVDFGGDEVDPTSELKRGGNHKSS